MKISEVRNMKISEVGANFSGGSSTALVLAFASHLLQRPQASKYD